MGRLKFLDSYRFLEASSDVLSTTLAIDANETNGELIKKKLPYPKKPALESFYKPLKLRGAGYFSTLKQS